MTTLIVVLGIPVALMWLYVIVITFETMLRGS